MRWFIGVGGALLGVVIAVGITLAANTLTSQSVGLSDEPLTAGAALAPAAPSELPAEPEADEGEKPGSLVPDDRHGDGVDDERNDHGSYDGEDSDRDDSEDSDSDDSGSDSYD